MTKPRRLASPRKGAAVAELAVALPAIVLLVLGAIECCSMIFVKQGIHIAAYEGMRMAIRRESSTADVTNRCNGILTERSINGAAINLTPGTVEVARGTPLEIQVVAPCAANSILPLQFFSNNLTATVRMIKE